MRIDLILERRALRRWHVALAERLARSQRAEIGIALVSGTERGDGADALFQFETWLFGLARGGARGLRERRRRRPRAGSDQRAARGARPARARMRRRGTGAGAVRGRAGE